MAASGQGYLQAQQAEKKRVTTNRAIDEAMSKMNVMANNGAPPEVLKQYLQAKGINDEDFNRRAAELNLEKTTRGGAFGGFLRQMAQGATFGFADEAASGLKAAAMAPFSEKTFGEIYNKELGENRAADVAMQTAHPVASTVAQIAGAAVPIIATAGAATPAAAPTTVTGSVMRGAGAGAGYGGLAGFGNSEGGFENRAMGAGAGAAVGGILGGAIPAGVNLARGGINMLRNVLGSTNADDLAAAKVAQALQRDNMTPTSVGQQFLQAKAADPSKPITLADVGGENTRRLVDQTFITPGKAADRTIDFFAERQAAQGERVAKNVAKFLPDENLHGTAESLKKLRADQAAPLYEKAFSAGATVNPRITRFMNDPIIQQGAKQGLEVIRLENLASGKPFNPTDYSKAGLRVMDAAKRGLDDMLEAYRDKTTGRLVLDQKGRAIDQVRRALINTLDDTYPDYAAARAAWAGPSQAMDAMSLGRNIFSKDAEITAKTLADMPNTQKEFYRIGVFRAIMDRIGNAPEGADVLKRFFNTPNMRDRLKQAFPNPRDFAAFEKLMGIEKTMYKTAQGVLGNSKTAQRLAGAAEADQEALGTVGNVIMGNWQAALQNFARKQIAKIGGMRPEVADKISDILLTGDTRAIMSGLQALDRGVRQRVPMLATTETPFMSGMAGTQSGHALAQ